MDAKTAGTATITVRTEDGDKTAACTVTVNAATIPVSAVTLNKTALSLIEGASETLVAEVQPSDATNKTVSWTSSDTAVATVSNGTVDAKTAGTATITVRTEDGDKTATCTVTVNAAPVPVSGVTLNKETLTLIEGASETLTATVLPSNATNTTLSWSSDNTAVATVDANGKVEAKTAGTATITVRTEDGDKTAACTVTVESTSSEILVGTYAAHASNPYVDLSSEYTYSIVNLPSEDKTNVFKVVNPTEGARPAYYDLSAYTNKEITITFSAKVKRVGAVHELLWNVNNSDFPVVGEIIKDAAVNTWHDMGGTWTGTPTGRPELSDGPVLYLNGWENNGETTTYYVADFEITIEDGETNPQAGITIELWEDEAGNILASENHFDIARSGSPDSFTARINNNDGRYSNVQWLVRGILIAEGPNEITIRAANYVPGTYQLTVVVYKNGIPYSAEITFTVKE